MTNGTIDERERFERACYARYIERHAAGQLEDSQRAPMPREGLLWRDDKSNYGVLQFNAAWWAWQAASAPVQQAAPSNRAAFEAWHNEKFRWMSARCSILNCNYADQRTQERWEAWQAAAPAQPAGLSDEQIDEIFYKQEEKYGQVSDAEDFRIFARAVRAASPVGLSDAAINQITMDKLGKWPSFEAQSWACKVVHAILAAKEAP